ncbi:E3 ubiquitin-protein ligase MARCHF6 [Halotydeus destructor]|nr:E3 ubiquitin-protein ligase MARCHF6 [Halotydeus destructor]
MIGLLFDLVFIVPLRVPQHQTPIFYLWQDWAFGVLHTKVICGIALMADWQLRHDLVEVYENGLLNMDLKLILQKFAIPAILVLGHLIAVPYVFVHTLAYWNGYSDMELATVLRKTYPLMLFLGGGTILCRWQINKFRKLYEHIKNDKYLVGKRLVNYNPARRDTSLRPTSTAVVPQLQH